MDEGSVLQQLDARWALRGVVLRRLHGGMNSLAYAVGPSIDRPTHVAKWVTPELADGLLAGCETAAALAAHGLTTGEPVRTHDGELTASADGGTLALLRYVGGRVLSGHDDHERWLIGETLARVHTATKSAPRRGGFDGWLSPDPQAEALVPWLAGALSQVRSERDALPALTWATLHTDPAPEAFLLDEAIGRVGVIDWAGSRLGPVLYDVASAVMYLGGLDASSAFLSAYEAGDVLAAGELGHLDALRRFRWGVQASYFAGPLAADDQTGLDEDPDGNERGLEDARRGLDELGVRCGP